MDVVSALTDSIDPNGYIKDMRRRNDELSKGWGQIATPLLIQTEGGPQKMNCANTEGITPHHSVRTLSHKSLAISVPRTRGENRRSGV